MSKPLELKIYRPIPECPQPSDFGYAYEDWMDNRSIERTLTAEKRLTDTELAAELFRQCAWLGALGRTYATDEGRNVVIEASFTFGPITRDEYEFLTISHFLNLPHYDEDQP